MKKMKMKKIFALALSCAMTASLLAGCGSSSQQQQQTTVSTTPATVAASASAGGAVTQPDGYKGTLSFIVSSSAGSATDTVARSLADNLDLGSGVNVVVENVEGGGQTVGTTEAIVSRPGDGYTMVLMAPAGLISQPLIQGDALSYSSDDMRIIANLYPFVTATVVVSPESNIKTADDFYNFITSGESYNYGVPNIGGYAHVGFCKALMELDKLDAATPVTYSGSQNVMQAVLNGEVAFALLDADFVAKHVESGELNAVMVLYDETCPLLPDVATTADYGITGMNSLVGFKFLAVRKDTPNDIVEWIKQQITVALQSDDYTAYLNTLGVGNVTLMSEEEVTKMVKEATETYREVLIATGDISK